MSTEYIERGELLEGLKFPTREEIEKRYIEIEADQRPLDVLVDTMLAISRVYLEKVKSAPAADVEPVVRCRNCEHGAASDDETAELFDTDASYYCNHLDCSVTGNGFCSAGKRKERA